MFANFPASASGGGARNFKVGRGGEGVRSGDLAGEVGAEGGEGTVVLV